MEQLLFTPEEVARVLHISRRKIYALLQSGELHSVKIGRCRRVSRATLENFVERCTRQEPDTQPTSHRPASHLSVTTR